MRWKRSDFTWKPFASEPIIECKNNSQPVVFFLKTQPVTEINDNHIKYAGYPASSADPDTKLHVPLHKLIGMKDWHHYCAAPDVGTQFCSFSRDNSAEEKKRQARNGKPPLERADWCWKAESMEQYSKSFSSLCIAVAMAGVGSFGTKQQNIEIELYYPIIIFQGPIYEARAKGGDIELQRTDHLQIHHSASVDGRVLTAQMDVVSEKGFPALLDTIQRELTQTAEGIRKIEPRLLASAINQKEVASHRAAGPFMPGPRKGCDW